MQPDTCPFCGREGLTRAYAEDGMVYSIDPDIGMEAWSCLACQRVFWTEDE